MLSTSLKRAEDVAHIPPIWVPQPVQWNNYATTWTNDQANFPLWTRNTLIVASLAALGMCISSAIVAYGFARIKFRGRGFLFAFMLATMMIPFPVTMSSLFIIFRSLGDYIHVGLTGTTRPLWIPAWFGSAFCIFLLRQFFMTIPEELSEAARIDGCSEWGILWRIIIPLSKPALTAIALFTFIGAWRDFLGPLVYIQWPDQ
jgi:multiple sugar transport system permease protein